MILLHLEKKDTYQKCILPELRNFFVTTRIFRKVNHAR